jgi:mannose-6-phosphate isomerase-like protein (cupin superfamily)
MKRLPALTLVAMLSSMLHATDPAGFALWKGDDVAKSSQELPSKMDAQKFAWLSLANYDNHLIGISHREGNGSAELHQTQTDILLVQEGTATLVVGGTVINPKTVQLHEVRGTSIQGGETKRLSVGDIIHIPANVPHQLKISAGTKFTYLVIKVDSK